MRVVDGELRDGWEANRAPAASTERMLADHLEYMVKQSLRGRGLDDASALAEALGCYRNVAWGILKNRITPHMAMYLIDELQLPVQVIIVQTDFAGAIMGEQEMDTCQ